MSPFQRAYRLCLHALPRSFRRAHGPAMRETFRAVLAEAGARGRAAALRVTAAECADVVRRGIGLRLRRERGTPERGPGRRAVAAGRRAHGEGWMGTMRTDVRHALRGLRKRPLFAGAVLLTLALGIGAVAAIFTVVDAVLLEPLPYPASERLVRVWPASPRNDRPYGGFSVPDFEDWVERATAIRSMGLYSTIPSDLVLQTGDGARELATAYVSPGFFETMAVPAALGRTLRPGDEEEAVPAAVISHRVWRGDFGADPALVGRTLVLKDRPFRVVGVMPASFAFPDPGIDVWTFLSVIPESSIPLHLRPVRFLDAVARLDEGVTVDEARARLSAVAAGLARDFPDTNAELDAASVEPLRAVMVGDVRRALWVLLGAVGFTLLIACANVANLLLARGSDRGREMAIRVTAGATGKRLTLQLLTESLTLAALGGILGWFVAAGAVRLLRAPAEAFLPRAGEVAPDAGVLAFAAGVTLLTGLLFGILPAHRAARTAPSDILRSGGRGSAGEGSTTRRSLVAGEVAVALVLLVGAGLMVRTLGALRSTDPGFEAVGRLAVTLTISDARYREREAYLSFYREAMERLAVLPEVASVGSIRHLPLRGAGEITGYEVVGAPAPPGESPQAQLIQVSPALFRTLGIELLAGRGITDQDAGDAPLVGVVSEALARQAFGGAPPPGSALRLGEAEVPVVGMVEDVRLHALDRPAPPTLYVSQESIPRRGMTFVLRTEGDPTALVGPVRDAFRSMDPAQPLTEITPVEQVVSGSLARPRFITGLLAVFAGLAAVLAAVGIGGVVAYQVGRRIPEIGIRMALGARRRDAVRLVVGQGMVPVLAGTAMGLGAALLLSGLVESLLYGVPRTDPLTYGAVAGGVVVLGLVAAWLPARAATRVDPARALRSE